MADEQEINVKFSNYFCCVPLCNSNGRYDNVSFHHFPADENLKKQWIIKIRRDVGPLFKITKSTVVCGKHFTKDDYTGWNPVRKRLKKGAVPSVFDWTTENPKRRKLERKQVSDSNPSDSPMKTTATSAVERVVERLDSPDFIAVPLDQHYKNEINQLQQKLDEKSEECARLKKQIYMEKFLVCRFSHDDKLINFYTGFSSYVLFLAFFKCIEPSATSMQMLYYEPVQTFSLAGRKRSMLLIDELFLFLCRLKVGLLEQDLSVRFNTSVPTVSRLIVTWANFLYMTLGRIPIWLSRSVIDKYMPDCFRLLYPKTRVIIDCTEIKTQQPSSLLLNSQLYSNYKSSCTFKCLIGIAPHGLITFVSLLYTGCMSDIEITKLSGILDLLEAGDDVMADKGFTLRKILAEKGVTLNIPPFLSSKKQFSKSEIKETEQIAKLRIHIERVNKRIKEFHLFDTPVPLSLLGSANQLWGVACMLSNFKGPIVQSWSTEANQS